MQKEIISFKHPDVVAFEQKMSEFTLPVDLDLETEYYDLNGVLN